jgi:two-component system chemotaxis response regulator CheB
MPAGFTHSLADRLNSASALKVKEAEPGDTLQIGQVLLAPGGFHMTFDGSEKVALNQNPAVHGVRPAVDVTLTSLVQRFGKLVTAVILYRHGQRRTPTASVLLHSMGMGRSSVKMKPTCVVWGCRVCVVAKPALPLIITPLPVVPPHIWSRRL